MSESQTSEYKDTLNLVNTTLAMRANAAVRELEIQKFWEENHIYDSLLYCHADGNFIDNRLVERCQGFLDRIHTGSCHA